MKHLFRRLLCCTLAALVLSGCCLRAEAKESRQPMVLASRSNQNDGDILYFYNKDGTLAWEAQLQWDWYTRYGYYADGTLKSATLYKEGEIAAVTDYDTHGNLRTHKEADFHTGKLETVKSCTNRYDAQGRLTQSEGKDSETMYQRSRYTYHADGSWDVEYQDYYVDSETGEEHIHCHHITRYDPQGRVTGKQQFTTYMYELNSTTVYRYDDHGNLTEDRYEAQTEAGLKQVIITFDHQYDRKGRLTHSKETLRNVLGEDDYSSHFTVDYTYDTAGNLTQKCRTSVEQGYEERTLWEYDEQGNVTYYYGSDPNYENSGITLLEETYTWLPLEQALLDQADNVSGLQAALSRRMSYKEGLVLVDGDTLTVTTGAMARDKAGNLTISLEMENHTREDLFVTGRDVQLNRYNIFTSLSSALPARETTTVTFRLDPVPLALLGQPNLHSLTMELDVDTFPNSKDVEQHAVRIPFGMTLPQEPLTYTAKLYESPEFTLSVIGSSLNEGDGLLSVSFLLESHLAAKLYLESTDGCTIQGDEYSCPFFLETTYHGKSTVAGKIYGFRPEEISGSSFTARFGLQIVNKNFHELVGGTLTLTMDKTGKILSCKSDIDKDEDYQDHLKECSSVLY